MSLIKTQFLYEVPIKNFIFSTKKYGKEEFLEELKISSKRFLWFYDNLFFQKKIEGYKIKYDAELRKYRLYLCYEELDLEVRFYWIQALGFKINQYFNIDGSFYVPYN